MFCKGQYAKDLDRIVFPGIQGGPLMHVIAAKAVCFREALQPEFAEYQKQIIANAKTMAEALAAEGFRIVAGGTDTHLMLVDVFTKKVTGRQAQETLERQHHRQQERHPLRRQSSGRRERHPCGNTRRHHPRHERTGNAADRALDRRSPEPSRGRIHRQASPRPGGIADS